MSFYCENCEERGEAAETELELSQHRHKTDVAKLHIELVNLSEKLLRYRWLENAPPMTAIGRNPSGSFCVFKPKVDGSGSELISEASTLDEAIDGAVK